MSRKGLMVCLTRPPCLAIALATAGQRIRQKILIFSVISLWGVGPTGRRLCALE